MGDNFFFFLLKHVVKQCKQRTFFSKTKMDFRLFHFIILSQQMIINLEKKKKITFVTRKVISTETISKGMHLLNVLYAFNMERTNDVFFFFRFTNVYESETFSKNVHYSMNTQ